MTDYEILEKAIKKAKRNGYNGRPHENEILDDVLYDCSLIDIIFSKDFAKAFWGERRIAEMIDNGIIYVERETNKFEWQFHLQQLVLEEEPLKYIAKFLDNEE